MEGANGYPRGVDVRGVRRVARGEDEIVEQKTISFFLRNLKDRLKKKKKKKKKKEKVACIRRKEENGERETER